MGIFSFSLSLTLSSERNENGTLRHHREASEPELPENKFRCLLIAIIATI